jgi:hypothetical protein
MTNDKPTVSRFPNGVATNEIFQNLGQFILPDPTSVSTFFDDFFSLDVNNTGDWIVTLTTPGDATAEQGDRGLALLNTGSNLNDLTQIQKQVGQFLMESGKEVWFKTRFRVSDSVNSAAAVGLQVITADATDSVSDGIYFEKRNGDATLRLAVTASSVSTFVDVTAMEDNTYYDVGFYFDGDNSIQVFLNNEQAGSADATNLPVSDVLAPVVAIKTTQAALKQLTVDKVFVSKAV